MDLYQPSQAPIFSRLLAKRQHYQGGLPVKGSCTPQDQANTKKKEPFRHKFAEAQIVSESHSNHTTDTEISPQRIPPEGDHLLTPNLQFNSSEEEDCYSGETVCRKRKLTFASDGEASPMLNSVLTSTPEEEREESSAIPDEAFDICSARKGHILQGLHNSNSDFLTFK
jgi:hypothetical protein